MNDHPTLLREAASQNPLRPYRCPGCQATVISTEPINMIYLCTLCEEVLVEGTID